MSQGALATRDQTVREVRSLRNRRETTLAAGFNEAGVAGRRTGVVVQETVRDQDGLESLDAFFNSSPAAATPAPKSIARQAYKLDSSGAGSQLGSARRFPMAVSRSPIITSIGSPLRPSSRKKRPSEAIGSSTSFQQSDRHNSAARQSHAAPSPLGYSSSDDVARTLNFNNRFAQTSTGTPRAPQKSSPLKRKRTNEYGESEEEQDQIRQTDDEVMDGLIDGVSSPPRSSPAKRLLTVKSHKVDLPSTAAPFDHDLLPTMYSDEEDEESLLPNHVRSEPEPGPLESVYDFPVSDDDHPSDIPTTFDSPISSRAINHTKPQTTNLQYHSTTVYEPEAQTAPTPDSEGRIGHRYNQNEAIDVSDEDQTPAISSKVSRPSQPKEKTARKSKGRVHPRDRNPKARISSVTVPTQDEEEQEVDEVVVENVQVDSPEPLATKTQAPKKSAAAKKKAASSSKNGTSSTKVLSAQDIPLATGPTDRKPAARSLQILRQESEAQAGSQKTRSGRQSIRPVNWWCGERVERSYDGTIQGVTRADEVVAGDSKAKPHSKAKAKSAVAKKGKAVKKEGMPAIIDEEDESIHDEEEEWEKSGRVLCAWVRRFGSDNNDDWDQTQIAFPQNALVTQPAEKTPYRFAKYLSLPFMGAGLVDLPPGGYKGSANSGKMHMVFFVHSGRVWARVGDLPIPGEDVDTNLENEAEHQQPGCEFTIGEGGLWVVPRGTKYSIANDNTKPARLFFFQACDLSPELLASQTTGLVAQAEDEGDNSGADASTQSTTTSKPKKVKRVVVEAPTTAAKSQGPASVASSNTKGATKSRSRKKAPVPEPEVKFDVISDNEDSVLLGEREEESDQEVLDTPENIQEPPPKAPRLRTASGRGGRGKRPARGRIRK